MSASPLLPLLLFLVIPASSIVIIVSVIYCFRCYYRFRYDRFRRYLLMLFAVRVVRILLVLLVLVSPSSGPVLYPVRLSLPLRWFAPVFRPDRYSRMVPGRCLVLLLLLVAFSSSVRGLLGLVTVKSSFALVKVKSDRRGAGFSQALVFFPPEVEVSHRRISEELTFIFISSESRKTTLGSSMSKSMTSSLPLEQVMRLENASPGGGDPCCSADSRILPRLGHGGVFAGPVAQVQGHIHPAVVGFNLLPFLILIDDAGAVKTNQIRSCRMEKATQQIFRLDVIKKVRSG